MTDREFIAIMPAIIVATLAALGVGMWLQRKGRVWPARVAFALVAVGLLTLTGWMVAHPGEYTGPR